MIYSKIKALVETLPHEPTQLPPNIADFLWIFTSVTKQWKEEKITDWNDIPIVVPRTVGFSIYWYTSIGTLGVLVACCQPWGRWNCVNKFPSLPAAAHSAEIMWRRVSFGGCRKNAARGGAAAAWRRRRNISAYRKTGDFGGWKRTRRAKREPSRASA